MEVKVLDATQNPIDLVSVAMGRCYAKDDVSEKRVRRAFEARHMSVFEHVKVTVKISGVSRALSHQLVRHRMASFCQESQRYVKVDTCEDWYVKPDLGEGNAEDIFDKAMQFSAWAYSQLLSAGIPAEDARYVLPNACQTSLVMTMNLRELWHFLELREDSYAQWEIRDLAKEIREKVGEVSEQWKSIVSLDASESSDAKIAVG